MERRKIANLFLIAACLAAASCQKNTLQSNSVFVSALKDIAAVGLNYRYEPDVPPPADTRRAAGDERNTAIQSDFDQNRPQESLVKTVLSPDGKRILVIYNKVADLQSEFRLDMYSADGRLLRKITADSMAVHFPDTILWSPDSSSIAFVAMARGAQTPDTSALPIDGEPAPSPAANSNIAAEQSPETNANTAGDPAVSNTETAANTEPTASTPEPAAEVFTFRSEQIYICNSDGLGLKPITQNEGLIYFYYVWSPDSTMLAALAATSREWLYLSQRADLQGEIFVPVGRPRLVEKTGRERRLDDAMTAVQPVWSPDSAKVAAAFDKQIRIYDAAGNSPTQAAVPLRNHLLLSSQAYDQEQQRKLDAANIPVDANTGANTASNTAVPRATLPDENTLVSFNPIIALNWPTEDQLYFQTAFVKRMKNEADSVMSFPRWHRLILTPQASALNN